MTKAKIKFRPHHFLCTLGFQGKGYSPEFVENYTKIAEKLRAVDGDQTLIEVVKNTDSVCTPCPHKRDELCATQEKISALDNAHAQVLEIVPGDELTWGEAKKRIAEKLSLEKFHQICAPCAWKKLGVCEQMLQQLKNRF